MPMMPRHVPRAFALVEALVALTLLSVALAGSAVLAIQAVRHERMAADRGEALRHAASLADALRALARSDQLPLQAVTSPDAEPACPVDPADCVREGLARSQLHDWQRSIQQDLPAGCIASVGWLPAPAQAYLVRLDWPAAGSGQEARLQLVTGP